MDMKTGKFLLLALVGACAAPVTATVAFAQEAPQTAAPRVGGPSRLGAAEVQAFLSAPDTLLGATITPATLSLQVRGLAISSEETLAPLLALVSSANNEQIGSIASGLARAVRVLSASTDPTDLALAARIQEESAKVTNTVFQAAFASATGEVETAALGGGAAGGGAGGAGALGGTGSASGTAGGGTGGGATPTTQAQSGTTFSGASSGYFASSGGGSSTTIIVVSPSAL
ncbi:hypothetical protein NBH19_06995 [Rhizobium sp. S95]|uniref:Uncharacterized protein n=1 Tax=Ciceribacter sichuanensis TaxID=2949647 RepID=A0AAJ1C1F6_9HYPH|nr:MULTISPECIES: hypothetical protein [unclassified Ciceribacter]MCM2395830.1 hypothetical protein [Ciceribacter sp. S95]MCO5960039.1 hypothetical protein [Ciceribacter sp. S101]